jgi:riboflavin synthase
MMFTGIVTERGVVSTMTVGRAGARLRVEAPSTARGMSTGDSVAVNGVCLTAVAIADGAFDVEAVPETLQRTNLGGLGPGSAVNLERPILAGGRFDGHIVQGHVDGVATVRRVAIDGDGWRVWFDAAGELMRYVAEKGSVALDGVSLTVSDVDGSGLEVVLIPHTRAVTTLGDLAPGARVNLEVDVLAKYVARLLEDRR